MDHLQRSAHRDRHVDRREHQLGAQLVLHRPADHLAREHIEHDRQVQKPTPRRDISRIGYPQAVGPLGVEPTLDQIGHLRALLPALRRHYKLAQRRPAQPRRPHQARHALATYVDPVRVKPSALHCSDPTPW